MKRFPIGFWNYTAAGELGPEAVRDWQELGMTYAMSPGYDESEGDDKAAMHKILDACDACGIRVIVCDTRAEWSGAADDPEAYRKQFLEAVREFGGHPSVFGFHVGDEPGNEETFADAAAAYRIQKEAAPSLTPFLNLLPYWKGIENETSIIIQDDYSAWVSDFARKAGLDVICYDCYWQMNPEDAGTDSYFENLRHYTAAAKAAGADPWTTLLSVGHFRYRCPNEDDLRWQLNTAVVSGMKGILWFFVYEREPASNYRVPPIDEFGRRTQTFEFLSRVNLHFQHRFGTFFTEAEHIATYHVKKAWGGYPLFVPGESGGDVLDVTTEDADLPAVFSIFRHEGKMCYAVCNNSVRESALFYLHFGPEMKGKITRLCWNGDFRSVESDSANVYYYETEDELLVGDWAAPGQMDVYRIES